MADFVQTMKDWRRMCQTISKKYMSDGRNACLEYCPLGKNALCGDIERSSDIDIAEGEQLIKRWVEENPEVTYPTWYEYLNKHYRAAFGDWHLIGKQCIPADIAEKLGIEPKEI